MSCIDRQELKQLPRELRTRFAPSPTGYLHLGHVASAIFVWGIAQARGAKVLIRIEDHDRQRCRAAYAAALREDLAWLGLLDLPETLPQISQQSEHPERYERAFASLLTRGLVYSCACSRKEIAARQGLETGAELRYDSYCRPAAGPTFGELLDGELGARLQLTPGEVDFKDLCLGAQRQNPAQQCGDLLVRERNGNWTYNFCVVVDDLAEDIDLIVRGQDILEASGRQLLARSLLKSAAPSPYFLHHPLIWESEGRKLSKRDGATSLRHLRESGLSASELLGRAAAAVGLQTSARPLAGHQLGDFFS